MFGYEIVKKKKAKTEFSKKLLYVIFFVTSIIIIFTLYMVWKTGDTAPLSYLIPSTFGQMTAATSFYFWKAKAENKIKLQKLYGVKIESESEEESI